jgi:hypothetical protein
MAPCSSVWNFDAAGCVFRRIGYHDNVNVSKKVSENCGAPPAEIAVDEKSRFRGLRKTKIHI